MKKRLFSKKLCKLMRKTRKSHKKWLKAEVELLYICIRAMYLMGYPRDDEKRKQLEDFVQTYDKTIQALETNIVSRARENCRVYCK